MGRLEAYTLIEEYNSEVMESMLLDSSFSINEREKLKQIKKHRMKAGSKNKNIIKYYYANEHKIGRFIAGHGLSTLNKYERDALMSGIYQDLDMENAHFNIILSLCYKFNFKIYDKIKYYCENRQKCLDDIGLYEDDPKTILLKIANGGSYYSTEPFLVEISEQMKDFRKKLYDYYKEYNKTTFDNVRSLCKEDNDVSFMALVVQTFERNCLIEIYDHLMANNIEVGMLLHDGLYFKGDIYYMLEDIENIVYRKYKIKIKLKIKPNESQYVIKTVHFNDRHTEKVFLDIVKDKIGVVDNKIYLYNKSVGYYRPYNEKNMRIFLNQLEPEKILIHYKNKPCHLGSDDKLDKFLIDNFETALQTQIDNGVNYNLNFDNNVHKILFIDGIYDMDTQTFGPFNSKIPFLGRINRKFVRKEFVNWELVNLIEDIFFKHPFKDESGLYLMKMLAIALSGDYKRKKFLFMIGLSNCGKSSLSMMNLHALDDFAGTFNANNLLSKNLSDDIARDNAWIGEHINTQRRMIFSNEIRDDGEKKIDNNTVKTLASGGDPITFRKLYSDPEVGKFKAMMFIFANALPGIDSIESGFLNRIRIIMYNYVFTDNPTKENEKKKVLDLASRCEEDAFKDAYLWVLIRAFNNMTHDEKRIDGHIPEPDCVKANIGILEEEKEDNVARFYNRFEKTDDPEDFVSSLMLKNYFKMNEIKLGKFLNDEIGLEPRVRRDRVWGRIGVRAKFGNF